MNALTIRPIHGRHHTIPAGERVEVWGIVADECTVVYGSLVIPAVDLSNLELESDLCPSNAGGN